MKIWKSAILITQIVLGLFLCIVCIFHFDFILRDFNLPNLSGLTNSNFEGSKPQVLYNITSSDEHLEVLWVRSDLMVPLGPSISDEEITFETQITAANGVIFYIGHQQKSSRKVIALDAKDGETVLWHTYGPGMGPTSICADSSALYVGGGGNGKVAAYDLRTGEELWTKLTSPLQRTVTLLRVPDDLVYVKTVSGGKFLFQADSGKRIYVWDWSSAPSFDKRHFLDNRVLTPDMVFSNFLSGEVFATDRQTDDILWKTTNVVSNVAATGSVAYLLTDEPSEIRLLRVEPRNGEITTTVTFEPSTQTSFLGANQITVDEDLGILYVFLGISRQLFAFKLLDYPNY